MWFDYSAHPGKKPWASNILNFIGVLFGILFFKVKIEIDPDAQKNGPVLILSKHSAEFDIPLGYHAMKRAFGRHAWCIMKASLVRPRYLGFFWKIGGIPLEREDPQQSKNYLVYARKVLYEKDITGLKDGDGNLMVLFPEQTTYWRQMGEGKLAGFRFLAGKPARPLACNSVGFRYKPGFPRTSVVIRFGPTRYFTADMDHGLFLHERMKEIAELSALEYSFPAPRSRKAEAVVG
ncbi:MAG TPA: lysophospholipid acyltransferase family protein [Leptospiraceae bacterium]|nr:1-acyl-sn-glycerol-3-phosphate acyltransferase [Leptospirales bacterium]HMU81850.1 lysophospholipid acyltransferase family protein [Leptospiraceae bacterium]HMX58112.1 lysophospholipid acyltransferase family protein [Leptospiraceae bacterium]HMY47117.1 lysophospholipid acyltransferase family protein [Leptospiraceae bacterium]HMZ34999.1 lysophospholipid acyltransferase family protein [Leptospiraceae bacterium]